MATANASRPDIRPVILSGGTGSRLWPISREAYPKQFLHLCGSGTMLQETALRVAGVAGFARPTVIAAEGQRFEVAAQMQAAGIAADIVLEPSARGTALPVAVAALLAEDEPSAVVLLMPADHFIADAGAFQDAALAAGRLASDSDRIVTFGIAPTGPETGYGYIRAGAALGDTGASAIAAFTEKPDAARARAMLAEGGHFWNAGLFAARADVLVAAFAQYAPDVLAAAREAVAGAARDLDFVRLAEPRTAAPAVSFDVAVMERTHRSAVIPARFAWSDLGSWQALWEAGDADAAGNVAQGDVLAVGCHGSYLHSDGPVIAALGLGDVVVVATDDAVLVADRARTGEVKALVEALRARKHSAATAHSLTRRPWGSAETLAAGPGFEVRRIVVRPGGTLSLQRHRHRAEHWVVVSGTAAVTLNGEARHLGENASVFVPQGAAHSLGNAGSVPLVVIEVQSGACLGEADTERLNDLHARA